MRKDRKKAASARKNQVRRKDRWKEGSKCKKESGEEER